MRPFPSSGWPSTFNPTAPGQRADAGILIRRLTAGVGWVRTRSCRFTAIRFSDSPSLSQAALTVARSGSGSLSRKARVLEASILVLEPLEPPRLVDVYAAVLGLPTVERLLTDRRVPASGRPLAI